MAWVVLALKQANKVVAKRRTCLATLLRSFFDLHPGRELLFWPRDGHIKDPLDSKSNLSTALSPGTQLYFVYLWNNAKTMLQKVDGTTISDKFVKGFFRDEELENGETKERFEMWLVICPSHNEVVLVEIDRSRGESLYRCGTSVIQATEMNTRATLVVPCTNLICKVQSLETVKMQQEKMQQILTKQAGVNCDE